MNWPTWESPDGRIRLINADCLEVLPTLTGIDAVVTDPPYGIGEARADNASRSCLAQSKDYGESAWDDEPASPKAISACRAVSEWQIIFGGNYFELPPSRCWLVWDKMNGASDFADCELAWTNLDKAVRQLRFRWHGMLRDEPGERVHPTQKPVNVMMWAMSHLPPTATRICDPFAGSMTTALACVRTERECICIERERRYWLDGIERVRKELGRTVLFDRQEACA